MNSSDYNLLFASLDEAVAVLARNRTPDPAFIAAYDTLKQSRARLEKLLSRPASLACAEERDRVAA